MSTLSAEYLLASETQLVARGREQIMLTCSFNNTVLSSNQKQHKYYSNTNFKVSGKKCIDIPGVIGPQRAGMRRTWLMICTRPVCRNKFVSIFRLKYTLEMVTNLFWQTLEKNQL